LGLNSLSASGSRFLGANDKIRVGFIGVGNRGSQLLKLFMNQPDCEVAALCDCTNLIFKEIIPKWISDTPMALLVKGADPKNG